jgi:transcription elongation factor/antiterminator RfaH
MEFWYVLNTKPHQEQCVAEQLRCRQLNVYLPIVRVNPVNPRAAREQPYFPGYIFARFDLQAVGISAVQWTPGLRRIVKVGDVPGIVPDAFISELRRRLAQISAAGGLVFEDLHSGDVVRIVSGPMAGYEAVFDRRLSGSDRVRVLLEVIRESQSHANPARGVVMRCISLELSAGCIEKSHKCN